MVTGTGAQGSWDVATMPGGWWRGAGRVGKAGAAILAASACFLICRSARPGRAAAMVAWWASHAACSVVLWASDLARATRRTKTAERTAVKGMKAMGHIALLLCDDECRDPTEPLARAVRWAADCGAKVVTVYDASGEGFFFPPTALLPRQSRVAST